MLILIMLIQDYLQLKEPATSSSLQPYQRMTTVPLPLIYSRQQLMSLQCTPARPSMAYYAVSPLLCPTVMSTLTIVTSLRSHHYLPMPQPITSRHLLPAPRRPSPTLNPFPSQRSEEELGYASSRKYLLLAIPLTLTGKHTT